jgi:hypothetical protein
MFYIKNAAFKKLVLLLSLGERDSLSDGSVRMMQSVQRLGLGIYNRPPEQSSIFPEDTSRTSF